MAAIKTVVAVALATLGAGAAGFVGDRYIFSSKSSSSSDLSLTSGKNQEGDSEGSEAKSEVAVDSKGGKKGSKKKGKECKKPSSAKCKAKQQAGTGG